MEEELSDEGARPRDRRAGFWSKVTGRHGQAQQGAAAHRAAALRKGASDEDDRDLQRLGTGGSEEVSPMAEKSDHWFHMEGSTVKFGASALIDAELRGPSDLARSWLLGDGPEDNSVDRLVHAVRPVGAEVRRAIELEDPESDQKLYALELLVLQIPGLGKARSTITMRGERVNSGGPQPDGGAFLDVGTVGEPRVSLTLGRAGPQLNLPTFDLNVRGALGVDAAAGGELSRAVGWVTIDIEATLPRSLGMLVSERFLRLAAQEVCMKTVRYASRRLESELTKDFDKWSDEHRHRALAHAES